MIHEVDEALRTVVRNELGSSDVEVVLEAPTKDWAARRNAPTVNLYLYDIREDLRRRELGWQEERGPDGQVVSRRPMPRWFKLSYLVTAWTQRPEDEHRLLASLLRCFLRHEAVPEELVVGALAEPGFAIPMTIGLPPPEDRGFADVWSALGGELKPSLDVVVVAPVDPQTSYPAGPPVTEGAVLDVTDRVNGAADVGRRLVGPNGSARSGGAPSVGSTPAAPAADGPAPRRRTPPRKR